MRLSPSQVKIFYYFIRKGVTELEIRKIRRRYPWYNRTLGALQRKGLAKEIVTRGNKKLWIAINY